MKPTNMKERGTFYNEWDAKAAAWLGELTKQGMLPKGHIDDRSITEIQAGDVIGYRHVHYFAGIGGWPLALKLAGWPDDRPVWTGSCPCQPFSTAGRQRGTADERHLWPEFLRLIRECRPPTIFGEQVASPLGRQWLAGVFADLEELGYAVAGADLCAAGIGAPHIRQRLFWVAHAHDTRPQGRRCAELRECPSQWLAGAGGVSGGENPWAAYDLLPCRDGKWRRVESGTFPLAHGVPARVGRLRGYGNAIVPQLAAEFIVAFLATETN